MEGKDVRRRFVQSTLFPHKESSIKEAEICGGDGEEPAAEEDLCTGGKKRRESKMRGNSKSKRAPRAGSKKVVENGKGPSSKQVDESDSTVSVKSSFFVKPSQRRQQKRQQNELVCLDSPEKDVEICSTPESAAKCRSTPQKRRQQDSSTPRKERRNSTPSKKTSNGRKASCSGKIQFDLAVDEQPMQTIPDLRLEAKLTAEENSRLFAGRQIHPFFSSWKGGKANQDLIHSESKGSSFERKEKGFTFNPIHVIEDAEVGYHDQTILDWGNWIFSESIGIGDLECGYADKESVDSLTFDNYLNVSSFSRTSLYQNSDQCSVPQKEASKELPDKPEFAHPLSSLSLAADRGVICGQQQEGPDILPKDTEDMTVTSLSPDRKIKENDLFKGISSDGSFDSGYQEKLFQDRIISHYNTCHYQPVNCLWTDKYQPQNAKQVCGNGESVKFLSEWLHLWQKRGSLTSRSCMAEEDSTVQDIDCDYLQSGSDCDSINDEDSLKNVLLITGPVGSGKSAAIYACARDQGFQVIEINASDWRNGALVKQKFGEAVESHWLQRTAENGANSEKKSLSKFFKAVNAETHYSGNEVIELIDLSHEKDSQETGACPKVSIPGETTSNCQNKIKTLILFEDVDATLYEDHGFVTTIQQLAETAKRPMILTSNSDNPVLPKNLDRLELSFSVPSMKELLELVHAICASEKANIHPCLVERFVDYCQRDIRKTIMLLQFWCQGQTLGRGNEFNRTHWPVPVDLNAGHHILPKVINFGYPSKLSELVSEEVVKCLILMEETHSIWDTSMHEDQNNYTADKNFHIQGDESDLIEVKKEAMLSMHSSHLDEVEYAQFEANNELFDFSCSPVPVSRRKGRRNNFAVLSSDSEEELPGGSIPLVSSQVSDQVDINPEEFDLNNVPISHSEAYHRPIELIYHSEGDKVEDYSLTEMSLVPESSFVPETEIINETELYSTTVSYGHFVDDAIAPRFIIQDQDSIPILQPVLRRNDQETLENNSDTCTTACVYEEEVGESLSRFEAHVPRGYLDECSRVDFMNGFNSLDLIEQTWKRMHDQSYDLRKYVTEEEKIALQTLTFANGMSDLIAEADLLRKDCQSLLFDSLESSMVPSDKIHSYSYYDNQLEMSSVIAQHGMCFYAKQIASFGLNMLDLASEMLSSSAGSVALGKLISQDQRKFDTSDWKTTKDFSLLTSSKTDSSLCDVLENVVPTRSYIAAKGGAFHEYMSALSRISRFESSRLSESIDNQKQRRARVRRHYLSSGSFTLLSEEISRLDQFNRLPKHSLKHESLG